MDPNTVNTIAAAIVHKAQKMAENRVLARTGTVKDQKAVLEAVKNMLP